MSANVSANVSQSEIKAYLASIGARGGAKSRRKLTKADARAMAKAKWAKWRTELPASKPKKAVSVGRGLKSDGGSYSPKTKSK